MFMSLDKKSIKLHEKLKGKIEVRSKTPVTKKSLSLIYTPGVAAVSRAIHADKSKVWNFTSKGNMVAVVSDGSAVLGLGNRGAEAALPVMEGKCVLFKELGGIDAFPICLATQDTKEIIKTVKYIAPVFGGINLEDIAAPACFEVEEGLQNIGIPVMHDDQHGTAVVTLAALINSLKVVKKKLQDTKIVVAGAGAAGIGIAHLFLKENVKDIILIDSAGAIFKGRKYNMNKYKEEIARKTNKEMVEGGLKAALVNADVFIGVSGIPGMLKPEDVKLMNKKPVIFALSNPDPEIMPHEAKRAGAAVVGTGRSDMPNQINNALSFPGLFRGALNARALRINTEMKLAAAHALANSIKPTKNKVLPAPLDKKYVQKVAGAVEDAAYDSGATS